MYPKVSSDGSNLSEGKKPLFAKAIHHLLNDGFEPAGQIAVAWTYGKNDGIYGAASGILTSVRPTKIQKFTE